MGMQLVGLINGQKVLISLTADAGAGNPVGTIIPMYKKSSPSGYLYCDGSTFDETQYPLLYAYLGTNVLPDLRELGLKGAEKNTTYIFDSTETDPRTGQAGTQNHDVFTQGEFKDDQLQSHSHVFNSNNYDFAGSANATSGSDVRGVVLSSSQNPYSLAVTNARKGDVTRGKSIAVYWYIKATSGLTEGQQDDVANIINGERSYSTSEINTGKKWIDGKDIYRKVIDFGALPNTNSKHVDHNIANIDTITEYYGVANNSTYYFKLPHYSTGGLANCIEIFATKTYVNISTGGDRSAFTATVTLEYTKTT